MRGACFASQRVERPRSRLRHAQIAHDVGQHERVQHGVERAEHSAQNSRQQRAALLGGPLLQELNRADGHAGKDCSRGAGMVVGSLVIQPSLSQQLPSLRN
jgi:hypothetical protein